MSDSSTLPPKPTPPPAPDISSLYGDQGGLVAAPPAGVHHGAGGSWSQPVEDLDAESPFIQHVNKAVEGGAGMVKAVVAPKGKTEAERLKNIVNQTVFDPSDEQTVKAGIALNRADAEKAAGHPVRAALAKVEAGGHALASGVPLVGPWAADVAEQVGTELGTGEYGAAAGDVVGNLAVTKALEDAHEKVSGAAEKIVSHGGEAVKSALSSAGSEARQMIDAKAPAGSAEAGKINLVPAAEITHIGTREGANAVKLKVGGEDKGALYYSHDGDTASVNSSWVDDSARGQGHGQNLILEAAAKAKEQGAKTFTSDPDGHTSASATRAWDALVEKGKANRAGDAAIEDGQPAYFMNLSGDSPQSGQPAQPYHPDLQKVDLSSVGGKPATEIAKPAQPQSAAPIFSANNVAQHDAKISGSEDPFTTGAIKKYPQWELKPVKVSDLGWKGYESSEAAKDYATKSTPFPPIVVDADGKIITGMHRAAAAHLRGDETIQAYTPTTSKVDLSSVGGTPVDRPEPKIHSEGPDWDRTHTAVIDGRKVGSVGVKVDAQGRAQIYGSVVKPELRGQGIGQKLYQSAIEDARAQGADRITSDSTNTTPDANRVWEKLKEKGHPVEAITHPNGKPGYEIDLKNAAPNEEVQASANRYNAAKGNDVIDHKPGALTPAENRAALADQYEALKHNPNDPAVKKAYQAMKDETLDQFNHAQKDLGIKFDWSEENPYENAEQMSRDVRQNKHLTTYTGGNELPEGHPQAEIEPTTGQSYNNLFRATHDVYGHAAGGNEFTEPGEEAAYQAHTQMYSSEARPAVQNETQGQSNWYFNNKAVREGKPQGDFAPQKAAVLPQTEGDTSFDFGANAKSDLQKVAEHYGEKDSPSNAGASFITPEGKHIGLSGKTHPEAIEKITGERSAEDARSLGNAMSGGGDKAADSRVRFLDENGAVRVRKGMGEIHVSVPKQGVTPEQVVAIKDATRNAVGKSGHITIERSDVSPETKDQLSKSVEFGNANSVDQMLKDIGAHPESKWNNVAGERAAKEDAGGIDPRTGQSDSKGVGSEIMPELRQPLDHKPTADDFQKFYEKNKQIFDENPELRVGWDNKSNVPGGFELNVGAVGDDAARVAKKLGQRAAFDIGKGEEIPTGGEGLRTEFPNYPLADRLKDLRGEPQSNIKGFEHLSQDFYDHMEPDERKYLEGNKTLQRNAMAQYHAIQPSVNETTNAMQSGAALGGWWKRYMDVFHGLVGGDGKPVGVKPSGLPLYHYTTKGFENFDPMVNGFKGDFGTHLGTQAQADARMSGLGGDVKSIGNSGGAHIRPVYADIKNPVRVQDNGNFLPHQLAKQLENQGIISKSERSDIMGAKGFVEPEKLRSLLESKGYDGLVYLNRVEGLPEGAKESIEGSDPMTDADIIEAIPEAKGNDSYVAFRPEQIKPKYPVEQIAQTIGPSHAEVLKQWHAALSANKNVADANNLAWHSYADWLDAGKPTDRKSIDDIIRKNGAQPEGSGKKGNAAISDTLNKKGKIISPGLDTTKLWQLVNSPEMKGERPFSNEAFNEETPNALANKGEGARKLPSMGATVAGKGNLNRLVIDAHIRDFYGHKNSGGPAAQYIADSVHLRQAAEALGLKGGEGQEQLWGTVLGLKTLLKEGLTPAEAAGKLDASVINNVGKDYAEVIANDPEIKPLLDRLYREHGIKPGKPAGAGPADQQAPSTGTAAQSGAGSSETPIDTASLTKTAERVRQAISDSKIKNPTGNPNDIGTVVSKFTKSKESYDILDRTGGKGGTWTSGGCWILADAVQKEYGGKLVAITTPEGRVQHIGTQIGNKIIDADGATSPEKWRDFWEKTEQVTGAKVAPLDPNKVPDGIPPPEKHDEIRSALRTQTSTPAPVPPPSRKISVPEPVEDKYTLALKAGDAAAKARREAAMKGISGLNKPAK